MTAPLSPQSWLDDHDNWLTWNERSVAEYASYVSALSITAALRLAADIVPEEAEAILALRVKV